MPAEGEWVDQDAGPVVRPYALTGGLTRPSGQRFDLLDMVRTARRPPGDPPQLTPEQAEMLERCQMPTPIAELAGVLDLPVGVIRILVSDLRERGLVTIHRAQPAGFNDLKILQEVVDGLRRL
ncbi:MAG TPA: DUF742 domain-containing protein [Streptosporangiaceae bacterium]|jgi:hypothetical protein|nr:DUF742 domain-containing protein [Streptosporangiaceae bacterium]HTX28741.1 DUF742 domain-containing protein [Streptosporangiaceae bacterium]